MGFSEAQILEKPHQPGHDTESFLFSVCCAKLLQSCPTVCDPIDCSPPGSSVHGILQAGILEWLAMPSSRGSFQTRDWTIVSCVSCIGWCVLYHSCHLFECVTVLLLFYVSGFWWEAFGILPPWPGIEPVPPALEGEVLTTGPPGKCSPSLSNPSFLFYLWRKFRFV